MIDLDSDKNKPGATVSLLDLFLSNVKKFDPFPILYARTSTGAVQTWKVEVEGNKYRYHTGQKGGAIVTSEWTICQGKNLGRANETTPDEQAHKEAQSAMAKKLKQGGYWEHEADIDRVRFFAPMLAHKWADHKKKADWTKGVYTSPKLDGVRTITNREGLFSRLGNQFKSFPHIFRELQALFAKHPNLILDGECYTHKLKADFDKLISLAKQQKPTPEQLKEAEALQYWIFDVPSVPGSFHERYQWLVENIAKPFGNDGWIRVVEHKLCMNEAEVEAELDKAVEKGFEGLMINLYGAPYEPDKRTSNILKFKLFIDEEFEFVEVKEGVGNRSGMFGYAILKMKDGRLFKANCRGNEAFYRRLLKDKNLIVGKKCTMRFKKYTPDGIPAHGSIIAIRDYE